MKKDKEIWLNPEEIQQLLEGGLYWKDIEPKLSPENADSFRRHLSIDRNSDFAEMVKSTAAAKDADDTHEDQDVRAILLGEETAALADREEGLPEKKTVLEDDINEADTARISKPAVDNELKEIILSNEINLEEPSPFGGLKLIILLVVVAVLTFAFWFYFLSR